MYSNPKYLAWQMKEIRLCLEMGFDIREFVDSGYSQEAIEEIRTKAVKNLKDVQVLHMKLEGITNP